jgi:hypothetical protein
LLINQAWEVETDASTSHEEYAMNLTIKIDPFSTAQQYLREREVLDPKKTRIVFVGDVDTPLLSVPGCLKVENIRMPGLIHEDARVDEVPLDTTDRPRMMGIERTSYGLIKGFDGTPMLARGSQCDFGMWRKGTQLFVTGEWDESINPPLDAPIPIPEVTHRRVGVEVGGPAESITRGRRAESKE